MIISIEETGHWKGIHFYGFFVCLYKFYYKKQRNIKEDKREDLKD